MKTLFVLLFCGIFNSAMAQDNSLLLGIEGGASLATLRGNINTDNYGKARIGYLAGLIAEYKITSHFSLKSGINYEKKGGKLDPPLLDQNDNVIGTIKGKASFEFISVPLLLRATFGNKINYFINVGPYAGLLLKQMEHTDALNGFPETNVDYTYLNKDFEFGISAGIGASLPADKYQISLEVRDNAGLTNLSKAEVINNGEVKTNAVYVLAGIAFYL